MMGRHEVWEALRAAKPAECMGLDRALMQQLSSSIRELARPVEQGCSGRAACNTCLVRDSVLLRDFKPFVLGLSNMS